MNTLWINSNGLIACQTHAGLTTVIKEGPGVGRYRTVETIWNRMTAQEQKSYQRVTGERPECHQCGAIDSRLEGR